MGRTGAHAASQRKGIASVGHGYGTWDQSSRPDVLWRPYSEASFWNLPVGPSPTLVSNSAAMISHMAAWGTPPDITRNVASTSDYAHPIYYSHSGDPSHTITVTTDSASPWNVNGLSVKFPTGAIQAGGGDGHLTVIDWTTGYEWSFWQVTSITGSTIVANTGGRTSLTGDGTGPDATAARNALTGGMIRYEEIAAGHIDHALFLVAKYSTGGHVSPALGNGATDPSPTDSPPMGQRFYLAYTDAEIDALLIDPWKKTVCKAFAKYGAYLCDTGSGGFFDLMFESPASYTSFSQADPFVAYGDDTNNKPYGDIYHSGSPGVGTYYYQLSPTVDWSGRLRAITYP